jgi:hypothetical protein
MLRIEVFFAASTAFSSSSSRAVVTISFARQSTVCVSSERLDATKWFTISSKLCGRSWSNDFLEPALLAEDAGEGGDAIVEARQTRVDVQDWLCKSHLVYDDMVV